VVVIVRKRRASIAVELTAVIDHDHDDET